MIGTTDAEQLLLSLPVLVNVAVPPLTGFVIDKSAVVSAYGDVNVNTSDHQFFSSDSAGVRCAPTGSAPSQMPVKAHRPVGARQGVSV